jgi:hypothetical protein
MYTRRHYIYTKRRSDLWEPLRIDRDRTTVRIELGIRAAHALLNINPRQKEISK